MKIRSSKYDVYLTSLANLANMMSIFANNICLFIRNFRKICSISNFNKYPLAISAVAVTTLCCCVLCENKTHKESKNNNNNYMHNSVHCQFVFGSSVFYSIVFLYCIVLYVCIAVVTLMLYMRIKKLLIGCCSLEYFVMTGSR